LQPRALRRAAITFPQGKMQSQPGNVSIVILQHEIRAVRLVLRPVRRRLIDGGNSK
jgi:hypothetical protein